MATKPKQTAVEVKKRVMVVHDLLLTGASRAQVIQYASEETDWNITDRQIDNYIKRANKHFAAAAEPHREREFGLALKRLDSLLQQNLKIQDFRVALSILKERHSLLGLYPPATLHIKLTNAESVLLTEILDSLTEQGIAASDLFEAMLQEVSVLERETDE